uniref:Phosphatidylserine decarboxylase n=1 Tax=viral metagenome TaxID=1070528 RepID=A0A6C0K598_9ZZZZ
MPSLLEIGIEAQRFLPGILTTWLTKGYCNEMGKSRRLEDKLKFAKEYKINWRQTRKYRKGDTLETCLAKFPTLNSFFAREIDDSLTKPSTTNPNAIVSPAYCYARRLQNATNGTFDIKGAPYTLETLVRRPIQEAAVYIFRLAPHHYHRIHSPIQGTIKSIESVGGHYRSVNPILLDTIPVLQQNYRKIITFTNGIILVAIGATAVGSINLTVHRGFKVEHGQDIGDFQFGGSCLALIVPHPLRLLRPSPKFTVQERDCSVGDYIGLFA